MKCQHCGLLDCMVYHVPAPPESVNHPAHYQGAGMEAIDVIEAFGLGFCLGNALKYIVRSDKKGAPIQDLEKARWYLDREIASRKDRGQR